MQEVTVILTNSRDVSVDRIIDRLGTKKIFRLNVDLWEEYQVVFSPGELVLKNPAGVSVSSEGVSKAVWRKPLSKQRLRQGTATFDEAYREKEILYVVEEIKNLFWRREKLVLVEPHLDARAGKLLQLEIAREFFIVPSFLFFSGESSRPIGRRTRVVKSLSSTPLSQNQFLWTTEVKEELLDQREPWFVQDKVDADYDVTVVFIRNRLFPFSLDRTLLGGQTLDWREVNENVRERWTPHVLPSDLTHSIFLYMETLGLHYGRLDFLLGMDGYSFLEVNSNGEWGWLDPDGTQGVLQKLSEEMDPESPVHPIPTRWRSDHPSSGRSLLKRVPPLPD